MTHITDEMVADKPSVDEIIQKFKAFVGDNILIGHNIKPELFTEVGFCQTNS